jgi:site-specific DNA-methyltransferase (adenine-specific)
MNIIHGDSLDKLKELEDNSVDSIVTDPPYGLSFMGKKWDYDVPSQKIWEECLRVLKPGGYLLAFAGTRTQHRMAVRIEDAGFEIRDMIAWVYGSGFPKSLNIGKAVDKLQGNEREVVGETISGNKDNGVTTSINVKGRYGHKEGVISITKGQTEWEGWGTALKPALEPITVARKPFKGSVAQNVLKYGTGGINIDGCRVEAEKMASQKRGSNVFQETANGIQTGWNKPDYNGDYVPNNLGRFPANLIHDGSDEVVGLFPDVKGSKASGLTPTKARATFNNSILGINRTGFNDSGSASRFFYRAKASKSERNKGVDSIVSIVIEYNIWKDINTTQQVKKVQLLVDMDKSVQKVIGVSGTESKNATEWNTMLFGNCTMEQFQKVNKSITKTTTNLITTSTILNWLTHLLTNDYTADVNYETENGGNLVENVANYNTLITTINEKMVSALGVNNVVLGTQLKISVKEGSNIHSTVKPISLMRYLCRLVTPKGGTVLDPFMGSGTTGIGAKLEGFDFIGIEREAEYIKIAEARINAWEEDKQKKLIG